MIEEEMPIRKIYIMRYCQYSNNDELEHFDEKEKQ